MKRILVLATLVLFSGIASAANLLAEIRKVSHTIDTIQLTEDGQLVVLTPTGTMTSELSEKNKQVLVWEAQMLKDAELAITVRDIVCHMMVPHPQYLYIGNGASPSLELTFTGNSCAFHQVVSPKEEYLREIAVSLKSSLLSLAQEVVK